MSNSDLIRHYPDFFVSEVRGEVLWVKFSGNFFHNIINFDKRDFLGDFFEEIKKSERIKTVIFQTNYSESGIDEYVKFFISHTEEIGCFGQMSQFELHRLFNIINQTICNVISLDKFTIQICQGMALNLFMCLGFACDYRIVSEDTVYYNEYKVIGGLPAGGGAFFLSNLLGKQKANELLLLKDQINAEEALKYGIVNQVTTRGELEKTALEAAKTISEIRPRTLRGVKKLTNYPMKELREYLTFEINELVKVCVEMAHGEEEL